MTWYTRETLTAAQSYIPINVEVATYDNDGCTLNIGTYCRVECPENVGVPFTLSLEPMHGYSWPFETLEQACCSAYLMESAFSTIREASKLSREKVPA